MFLPFCEISQNLPSDTFEGLHVRVPLCLEHIHLLFPSLLGRENAHLVVFITSITLSKKPCRTKQKCSEMAQVLPLRLKVESYSGEALPPSPVPSGPTRALR